MGNLTYTERFTNVQKYDAVAGSYTGLQIASKLNQKNGQDYKLLDAIDIDWNGAWLAVINSYINNTEELLEAIDNIADLSNLDWVLAELNTINENIDIILNSYVTKDNLNDILLNYQEKLIAGSYISIEDNVISTYGLLTYEDADEKFATTSALSDLNNILINYYYTKLETNNVAYSTAYNLINSNIIKNADPRFNDLEKISDWILSLSLSYIESIDDFVERINRLDDVVGFTYYNEYTNTYSYTGLIEKTYELDESLKVTTNIALSALEISNIASSKAITAYDIANTAYDTANVAYDKANNTYEYAIIAYNMAYESVVTIGIPHSDAYFIELNEEDIEILENDKNAFQVYSIRSDNESGIPHPDVYNSNSGLKYYKLIEAVEATGFYKDLEYITYIANEAKESADNSLFRLYTNSIGSTYAKLTIDPKINDGTNSRVITLEIDEADINELTGYIYNDGIITSYSLYNSLSYIFTPDFITNDD